VAIGHDFRVGSGELFGVCGRGVCGDAVSFSAAGIFLLSALPFWLIYIARCGATGAVAELLHGHLAAALHFNAAVTVLLPMLLWHSSRMYWTAVRDNRVVWPQVRDWSWRAALALVLLFAVVRDLTPALF
jgi:hypothetical protein